jgi:aryl sulfotransferase
VLIRPPLRHYFDWFTDSHHWDDYVPRADDIVIATAPKCGTTWMQRIVGLLIFDDTTPRSVDLDSPWIDLRFAPAEQTHTTIATQDHRRFLKSHLPFDGLPLYDDLRYIHVARDGRDMCLSLHNQLMALNVFAAGTVDPLLDRPYPEIPADPRAYFRLWLTTPVNDDQSDGTPHLSFFDLEASYWKESHRENLLLVHYADLKADLNGEMRRIAAFLDIGIDEALWPKLVAAATFEEMKAAGPSIKPLPDVFDGGSNRFFNKGTNARWRGVLTEVDLTLYDDKVREKFTPQLAAWIEGGRLQAGEPNSAGAAR